MMLRSILCIAVLVNSVQSYLASFYGNSFLLQSLEDLRSGTMAISLRFMTSSSSGILFFARGGSQTILIELVHSRLEVKINLGHGEEVLSTNEDESLNNLIWHEFKVIRSGNNVKIVLNREDVASSRISGPDTGGAKSNCNFGVFLGGIGGNVTIPGGIQPTSFFRGCMLSADMNGHDLLAGLESVQNQKIVYNVLSGCPKIFRMTHSEPLTFDSASSYIALRRWTTKDEGLFECMVKTGNRNGILLYNAGQGRNEFIGLEIVDGVVSASVNRGGGVVSLQTTTPVGDGRWHMLRFGFSPSFLDIRIDGQRTTAYIDQNADEFDSASVYFPRRNLDLIGRLYIGGVPDSLSPNNQLSLRNTFQGCIKSIKVNHRRKVYSEFLVTSQVSVGCKADSWFSHNRSSRINYQETKDAASELFAFYSASMRRPHSFTSPTTRVSTTISATPTMFKFTIPEITVLMHPLCVEEGGSAMISDKQISLSAPGISESDIRNNIVFALSKSPEHGYIVKSSTCGKTGAISEFNFEHVYSRLVNYCHDGSETVSDSLKFTVVWSLADKGASKQKEITSLLAGTLEFVGSGIVLEEGRKFLLPISITPVNDVPELVFSNDYLFHPIRKVKTHLPATILNATDVDSPAAEILYTVLGNSGDEVFHLENMNGPGQHISKFTQEEINAAKIIYFHYGLRNNTRLFLGLSNSDASISTVGQPHTYVMRIAAVSLNISVLMEEVTLVEKTAINFTKRHILTVTNAAPGSVILLCSIKKMPNLGVIEALQSDDIWKGTSVFTMDQVYKGRVRYRNTRRTDSGTEIDQDRFVFAVSGADVVSEHHSFTLNIKKVDIEIFCRDILLEKGFQETQLTRDDFSVNVSFLAVTDRQVRVQLKTSPNRTAIYYNDNGLILDSDDSFTLEEARLGRISIRVEENKHGSDPFEELIPVSVVIDDRYESPASQLNVTYLPDLDRILLVNKGLSVNEGQELVLTPKSLWASLPSSPVNDGIGLFRFNIPCSPSNGILKLVGDEVAQTETELGIGITEFFSSDIERRKLYYRHDDSETTWDHFCVCITPVLVGQLQHTISRLSSIHLDANISVEIKSVNDQRPKRVIDKPFKIARNSKRLLTKDDLWYHDADSDYDDFDLVISSGGLPNGDFLNATSKRHEKISHFTQREIVNGEVLVKHRGRDFGRFVFWVRDGKHYSTGLFTLSASDPFLNILNNSAISVTKGSEVIITSTELWCETNVKGLQLDIIYHVIGGPFIGLLYLNTSALHETESMQAVSIFTQQDVIDEVLVYQHNGSSIMKDSISFRVSASSVSMNGNITVGVYLESHWKPPAIQRNRTVTVEQGKHVQIRKQDLSVVHLDVTATDIVFTIVNQPCMGSLKFVTDVDSEDYDSEQPSEFTQADINRGLVWYNQNDSFTYSSEDFVNGLLLDYFVFNVSNGILSVQNLLFFFDIIPRKIPLRLGNFSVGEGRTKTILQDHLRIEGPHFDDGEVEIRVISPPSHGILESQIGVSLTTFSYKLVIAEFLYYTHDGSDSLHDNFSLQAFTSDLKESGTMVAFVNVIPENDEKPQLVNNTGLSVWINSATAITSSSLAYIDPDTSSDKVNFRILPPSNGWVAEKSNPSIAVFNFTQAQVDDDRIIFMHRGLATGGFTFQADDGMNFAMKRIFVVTASPLIISVNTTRSILAFPGDETALPSNTLQSSSNDPDNPNRTVTFKITTQPNYGKFMKTHAVSNSLAIVELHNFTQNEIQNGLVFFRQVPKIRRWSEVDSFVVTASSFPAEDIEDIKLTINITYDAFGFVGKHSPIEVNNGCTVMEGRQCILNNTNLNAGNLFKKLPAHRDTKHYELQYSVASIPLHGNLSVSGKNVTKLNSTFTEAQLQSGKVVYTHDHSDTFQDFFNFFAYLIDRKFSASSGILWVVPGTLLKDSFNISVVPVNDNAPLLLTKGKILEVVDGFESLIQRDILEAVDLDNDASEILFSIIRPPTRGKVVFVHDRTTSVIRFSQEDINLNNVAYAPHEMNMTESKLDDAFYYGLTDGFQRSSYNSLQIQIVSVDVKFFPKVIEITQGYFSIPISSSMMNVSTNGNCSLITFFVTQPAKSGMILVNEEQSSFFTSEDLLLMKVEYVMTDRQFSEDSMQIELLYNRTSGVKITRSDAINITVMPLIHKGCTEVSHDGLTRIGLGHLNASALFVRTGSMPVFKVLKMSSYATLLKLNLAGDSARSKRDINNFLHFMSEVDRFSHQDVIDGLVFLHTENISMTGNVSLPDSIGFRLSVLDESVQSADFIFDFVISGIEADDFSSFLERFISYRTEGTTLSNTQPTGKVEFHTNFSMTSDFLDHLSLPSIPPTMYPKSEEIENAVKTFKPEVTKSEDPKLAKDGVQWLIPVAVVIILLAILVATLILAVMYRRQHSDKKNCSENPHDGADEQENVNDWGTYKVPREQQHEPLSSESLQCPACPDVIVTLLRNQPASDSLEVQQTYDGGNSASNLCTQSNRDDDPSTVYAPSTIYQYDHARSIDCTVGPEVEFFATSYPQRLCHARSAKLLDPDVLALYSSDESIPSLIDEKYAIPVNDVAGSVPSGLHRAASQDVNSRVDRRMTSRSAASLSKTPFSPELSALPDSGLKTSQYWI